MSKDIGGKISGAVFMLIMGIIIIYLTPLNFAAADSLNREFYEHCSISSETVRRVQLTGLTLTPTEAAPTGSVNSVFNVTNSSGSCVFSYPAYTTGETTTAAVLSFRTDSGTDFTVDGTATSGNIVKGDVTLGTGTTGLTGTGTWTVPGPVMSRFEGINRLVTSILPVLITVGLIAVVGFGSMKLWRGGNMASSIGVEVGIVIVVVVVMHLAPSMFDAITEGARANQGQYGVTQQFSTITDLIFGLLPLLVVLSLIGLLAWRGYSGYQSMRGGGGGGGAAAMMG